MFENLIYPDNERRAGRAAQLANDCETLASELGLQKAELDKAVKEAADAYQKAFKAVGSGDFERHELRVARSWVWEAPAPILGIVASIVVERALQQAFSRYLLSQGRIGEAAFSKLVGLPKWFRLGKFAGSFAAAMAVTVVIQLGLDAVDGAIQRSKLQDAIKDLAPPRFSMKRATMINRELISSLNGLVVAYTSQEKFIQKNKRLTPEEKREALEDFAATSLDEVKDRLQRINDDAVLSALRTLDSDRDAWTGEDATPDIKAQQPTLDSAIEVALLGENQQATMLA